jgi:hypothetical protein
MPVPGRSPEASMTTGITVPRLRAYDGPALLCRGFRPFLFVLVRVAAGIVVTISADVG